MLGGTPIITGPLDKDVVRRILKVSLNQTRFCYERSLSRLPALTGKLVLAFTISAEGKVLTSTIQNSTIKNEELESCIATRARTWTFPTGDGPSTVQYPLTFISNGQ